jgi:hypothetical protein
MWAMEERQKEAKNEKISERERRKEKMKLPQVIYII